MTGFPNFTSPFPVPINTTTINGFQLYIISLGSHLPTNTNSGPRTILQNLTARAIISTQPPPTPAHESLSSALTAALQELLAMTGVILGMVILALLVLAIAATIVACLYSLMDPPTTYAAPPGEPVQLLEHIHPRVRITRDLESGDLHVKVLSDV